MTLRISRSRFESPPPRQRKAKATGRTIFGIGRLVLAALAILVVLMHRAILSAINDNNQTDNNFIKARFMEDEISFRGKIKQDPANVFRSVMMKRKEEAVNCSGSLHFVPDKILPPAQRKQSTIKKRKIPRIIHQTSKDRCLADSLYNTTKKWRNIDGWEYTFYDDKTIDDFFQNWKFPEFPHLSLVWKNCILSGTVRADLFRYLILYTVGGLYADIDSAPNSFNADTIQAEDDGFFVVEQYHMLSQYFMAVSPRHPLMYYAIQRSLLGLLEQADTGKQNAAFVTGPHALHAAYRDFRLDNGDKVRPAGSGYKPVWKGTFVGTGNHSIRVVGVGENENEYVWRSLVKKDQKLKEYKSMGMEHFAEFQKEEKSTGESCLSAMHRSLVAGDAPSNSLRAQAG